MCKNIFDRMLKSLFYVTPFVILYVISTFFLTDTYVFYLFDWTARNSYMYLWVVVMILAYFGEYYMATVLNIANIIGIFVGEFLGDYLSNKSISSITPDMSEQEIAQAYYHYGVAIWIITMLIIVVLAILIKVINRIANPKKIE